MVYGNVSGKNVNCGDPATEMMAGREGPTWLFGCRVPGSTSAALRCFSSREHSLELREVALSWEHFGCCCCSPALWPSLLLQWSHTDQLFPGGAGLWQLGPSVCIAATASPGQLPSLGNVTGTGPDEPRQLGCGASAAREPLLGLALRFETNAGLL